MMILGMMEITTDGIPSDSAYEYYWADVTNNKTELTPDETYAAMVRLLEGYSSHGEGEPQDITCLLNELAANPVKHKANWDAIVQRVINPV